MSDQFEHGSETRPGTPPWVFAALAILGVVALFGLVVGHNASTQAQEVQQTMENKLKTVQADLNSQVAQVQQHLAQADTANSSLQSDLGVVTKRLRLTQGDLKKARQEAVQIKADSDQKLAEIDGVVKTEQTELATKASSDDVKVVDGKVSGVRTDLDTTTNDLKMARSELGTLIARNHEEVDQLRRMGERDYLEFTIDAKNKPQKVGSVMVELRGTNPNKKRYNVYLTVDDVRIDKKNLPVNEPIFFHQGKDSRALELVVNVISKYKMIGYISVPKAAGAQTAQGD
jgi:hypothetical protein